jgi:hypothetical protein
VVLLFGIRMHHLTRDYRKATLLPLFFGVQYALITSVLYVFIIMYA